MRPTRSLLAPPPAAASLLVDDDEPLPEEEEEAAVYSSMQGEHGIMCVTLVWTAEEVGRRTVAWRALAEEDEDEDELFFTMSPVYGFTSTKPAPTAEQRAVAIWRGDGGQRTGVSKMSCE